MPDSRWTPDDLKGVLLGLWHIGCLGFWCAVWYVLMLVTCG